jgi:hypothetical protein
MDVKEAGVAYFRVLSNIRSEREMETTRHIKIVYLGARNSRIRIRSTVEPR